MTPGRQTGAQHPASCLLPNRKPERPDFAAPACDWDDGSLSHPESHPARRASPPERPAAGRGDLLLILGTAADPRASDRLPLPGDGVYRFRASPDHA